MNGFKEKDHLHHLNEDNFGAKAGSIVSAFDAFRKFPPSLFRASGSCWFFFSG